MRAEAPTLLLCAFHLDPITSGFIYVRPACHLDSMTEFLLLCVSHD